MALIRIYSKNNYSKWGIPEMFWMCATKQQQQSSQTNIQLRWRLTSETRDKKSAFLWLLLFSHSVMSDSLWPHGLQHSRLPCPSLSPRVCSNSCPLNGWCHPTISSSVAPSPLALYLSQHQSLFQWVSSLHQVAKVLGFSIISYEYSVLVSFRIDWFDLLAVQGTLKSPLAP